MRKYLLVLIFLFLFGPSSLAEGVNWQLLATSKLRSHDVDVDSIRVMKTGVQVWTKDYEDPSKGYFITYWEIRCDEWTAGVLKGLTYDGEGEILQSSPPLGGGQEPIVPGSVLENLAKMVCEQEKR